MDKYINATAPKGATAARRNLDRRQKTAYVLLKSLFVEAGIMWHMKDGEGFDNGIHALEIEVYELALNKTKIQGSFESTDYDETIDDFLEGTGRV